MLMFGLKFEPHHPDPNMNEYIKSAFYLVPVACLPLLHGWGAKARGCTVRVGRQGGLCC